MIGTIRRGAGSDKRDCGSRLVLLMLAVAAAGGCGYRGGPLSRSAKTAYCPVCGMKVGVDGPLTCQIVFSDDTKLMFESPGDMLQFYLAPETYGKTGAQKDRANIRSILVRDYQTHEMLAGESATFVYNSRVKGPMGDDIFAFKDRSDAASFASEHGGSVVVLSEITPEIVRDLRK
ncbi:MAG TPA: nitrous oxide reductase accessory protein NosL [Blastocatellia bacterium]|nr:nitrous oxide reductase accessory protein NosL [Blastocatellia bacterium]